MDVTTRNFFRLLRAGAFHTQEDIEPLSVWKWKRLYQLSLLYDVATPVYEGIKCCRNQFFLQLPKELDDIWQHAGRSRSEEEEEERNEFLYPYRLTHPLLNRRLQDILDDEHSDSHTRRLLVLLLRVARYFINEGFPVKPLVELGLFLRSEGSKIDFFLFDKWTKKLKLNEMDPLTGDMLITLLGFTKDEVPFASGTGGADTERIVEELLQPHLTSSRDWYFQQGEDNFFVHNSNSTAMFWYVKRSARYFKYYPSETFTNFLSSFAHSLSHIEE